MKLRIQELDRLPAVLFDSVLFDNVLFDNVLFDNVLFECSTPDRAGARPLPRRTPNAERQTLNAFIFFALGRGRHADHLPESSGRGASMTWQSQGTPTATSNP
jgi:hypothetical protein